MLTNDQLYHSRDASVAQLVAAMMALKYFDEQFMYYALAYAEDGRIKYRLHTNPLPLYRFQAACPQKGLCPTAITKHVQLSRVPSGQEELVAAQVRQTIIDKLQAAYPKALFQALENLGRTAPSDAAQPLLASWQEELALCYDADAIALFAGLCQRAYAAKRLTAPAFAAFTAWSSQRSEQIANCENVIWRKRHDLHGLLVEEGGQLRIYSNAELPLVLDRAYKLEAQGLACTPILSKHYWLDAQPKWSLQRWRAQFESDLQSLMDEGYRQRFQALLALASPISAEQFAKASAAVDTAAYPQAAEVLAYYQNLWAPH